MREPADYEGRLIQPGETPETIIKIWEIDPHPTRPGICLWERSWQAMLEYVSGNLEGMCERDEVDEPDGLKVTFRVIEVSLGDYLEATTDTDE
jgi:hypothetical protein